MHMRSEQTIKQPAIPTLLLQVGYIIYMYIYNMLILFSSQVR